MGEPERHQLRIMGWETCHRSIVLCTFGWTLSYFFERWGSENCQIWILIYKKCLATTYGARHKFHINDEAFFFVGWILRQTVHELIFIESGKSFFWNWVSFHEMEQFNLLKDSYLMLQSPSYWIKVKRESKFQDSIMIRMLLQNVMFRKFFIGSCFVSGTNWIGKISLHNFPKGQFRKDVWELFRWRI